VTGLFEATRSPTLAGHRDFRGAEPGSLPSVRHAAGSVWWLLRARAVTFGGDRFPALFATPSSCP
jgi:hypothetical protein